MSHYDIDIRCKKCGAYMYSVMDIDNMDGNICDKCTKNKLLSFIKPKKNG